jgi:hypothetical protein
MRLPSALSFLPALACVSLLLLGGCEDKNSNQLVSPTLSSDMSGIAAAAIAVGTAGDFGLAQLYQGTSAVAGLGNAGIQAALRDVSNGGPGIPAAQSVILDGATLATAAGGTASGTLAFTSDLLAPDGSALPGSWWHLRLDAAGQTTSFAVTADDGAIATLTSGALDAYVLDGATTVTSPGIWTQTVDLWLIAKPSAPVRLSVTPLGGLSRSLTLSGIRHVRHQITRTDNGTTVTRVDNGTVDGDGTTLVAAIPSISTAFGLSSGPQRDDSSFPRVPRYFASWRQDTALAGGTSHVWTFERVASWSLTQTKPTGSATWTGASIGSSTGSHYLDRDGVREGVYNNSGLLNRWLLTVDVSKSGRRL